MVKIEDLTPGLWWCEVSGERRRVRVYKSPMLGILLTDIARRSTVLRASSPLIKWLGPVETPLSPTKS